MAALLVGKMMGIEKNMGLEELWRHVGDGCFWIMNFFSWTAKFVFSGL